MGYETKFIIGVRCQKSDELKLHKNLRLDGDKQSAYRPMCLRNGKPIKTGKKSTYFMIYATIDLSKCSYDSQIMKLNRENKNENDYVYFYQGDTLIKTDLYDSYMNPIPIADVIAALEIDYENDDYRRYRWALDLLKSMNIDANNEIEVLFYGH